MPTLDLSPDELLTTTRTVRKRLDLDRPVPIELIRECLEIAVQAPTGSNSQTWQWVVVTDADLRRQIAAVYRPITEKYLEAAGPTAAKPAPDSMQRIVSSTAWLAQHMGDVPVLVLACIRAGRELPAGNQAGLWGSLLPGVWSYMLAARARGLGTAWTTLHLEREAEVAEILGLPPKVHQGALIPTAFYTGDTFKPAAREPLDTVLHINGW
jgi:nitroreductase